MDFHHRFSDGDKFDTVRLVGIPAHSLHCDVDGLRSISHL